MLFRSDPEEATLRAVDICIEQGVLVDILRKHKAEVISMVLSSFNDKYKDSREQFEQRTHKRLIDITAPSQKTVDALSRLEMPAGVSIDIKMKTK